MKPVTTPAKLKKTGSCGNAPASMMTRLSIRMVKRTSLLSGSHGVNAYLCWLLSR